MEVNEGNPDKKTWWRNRAAAFLCRHEFIETQNALVNDMIVVNIISFLLTITIRGEQYYTT
jgi:hypothetical protein